MILKKYSGNSFCIDPHAFEAHTRPDCQKASGHTTASESETTVMIYLSSAAKFSITIHPRRALKHQVKILILCFLDMLCLICRLCSAASIQRYTEKTCTLTVHVRMLTSLLKAGCVSISVEIWFQSNDQLKATTQMQKSAKQHSPNSRKHFLTHIFSDITRKQLLRKM